MRNLLFWIGRATGRKQPVSMFILAWVSLAESLVMILGLGFLVPHWRGWLLFECDWYNEWEKYDL